jgi:sorbitol/mannitol transport system substrate-binding protein
MKRFLTLSVILLTSLAAMAEQKTVNIVTVNNPDMITLKKLSPKFEAANPDIKLNWLVLEENIMRQRITTDVSTGGGQFDVIFIGLYEAPIFAKRGWLKPMENFPTEYDIEDVFKSLRDGLSYDGKLYALPFNGESSMLMYRKDLFEAKGLKVPEQATYDDIKKFAEALSDKGKGIYGITLRGKPGWGENMAYVTTLVNTFGGAYFDMEWHATIDTPEWKNAITYYVDLMKAYGPPGATSNGFNENLTIFATGKAAMWIDATSGAGPLFDPKESQVRQGGVCQCSHSEDAEWCPLAVVLGIRVPKSSGCGGSGEFALWATSRNTPNWSPRRPVGQPFLLEPGIALRKSSIKGGAFASVTLKGMQTADPTNPAIRPVQRVSSLWASPCSSRSAR